MNPAASRRRRIEHHERTGEPLKIMRHGEQVATAYRAHGDRQWRAYDLTGTQIGTSSLKLLDVELSAINVVKGREILT